MSAMFRCTNGACPNSDRGAHRTARAAKECGSSPLALGAPAGAHAAAAPPAAARPVLLEDLKEAHADGVAADEDILSMSAFRDLDHEGGQVLLDLVASDSELVPHDMGSSDLAAYVDEARTGFTDLTEWAENEILMGARVEPGESTENFANKALGERVWMLPFRDGSGQFHIMNYVKSDQGRTA